MKLRHFALLLNLFSALFVASTLGFVWGAISFIAVSAILTPRESACFANNFGTLTNTILIHDAFSLFLEGLLPIRDLVLDVQDPKNGGRTAKPGDTITVKDWRTTVTPYQVGAGGYNSPTDVTAGQTTVTLSNTPWAVSIALTAAEYRVLSSGDTGGADYEAFRTKLRSIMLNSLGKKIIDSWFAIITAANFTNEFVTAPGTFARSTEVDLDTKFFGREVPVDGANAILPPSTYAEWVKDHISIQTNTAENRQKGLLMSGGVKSQNSNFTFWRTNRPMPADAARGFVNVSSSTLAAFRIPDEATYENDPVSLSEIVDAATKIPLLGRLWKNAQTGTIQLDLASIFQFQKGQGEALERLVEDEE